MDLNFNEIRDFSKDAFKDLVRKRVRATAFEELKEIQKTHSKSKKLYYNDMKMQEYLTANSGMTMKEMAFAFAFAFSARAREVASLSTVTLYKAAADLSLAAMTNDQSIMER